MRRLTFDDRTAWEHYHRAYLDGLAGAQARLRIRALSAPRLALDGSVASLAAVGDWLIDSVSRPGLLLEPFTSPAWWPPRAAPQDEPIGDREYVAPMTRAQIQLIDEVQAYFAEVLETHPAARWVIFRGRAKEDRRGLTMLQLGSRKWPVSVVGCVFVPAVRYIDSGDIPTPGWLADLAYREFARRD